MADPPAAVLDVAKKSRAVESSSSSSQKPRPQKAVARVIRDGPDFKQQAQSNFEFYGVPKEDMERVFKEGMEEEVRRQCREKALESQRLKQQQLLSKTRELSEESGTTQQRASTTPIQSTEPVQDEILREIDEGTTNTTVWEFEGPDTNKSRCSCTIL